MGTASLIVGIGFMSVGFAVIGQGFLGNYWTVEQMMDYVIVNSFIGIPLVIVGALFLRKYDRDKNMLKKSGAEAAQEILEKQPEINLRKSPILKGTIIGIITVSILWGLLFSYSYQSFVVSNDAMGPTINKLDLIRYEQTPIDEIRLDDIVVYNDLSEQNKVRVHKVTGIAYTDTLTLRVKNEVSPTLHLVTEEHYIGKVTIIERGGGYISQYLSPQLNISILILAFVIPIVIMKLRTKEKKKEKNS